MSLTTGSLFSGYAGLDMAVNAYFGARTAWFVENDAAPSRILAHHWPDVPNHGDITAIDWTQVEPVDILCGGFPCQDVSAAGRRAGIRPGSRSGLWSYFAEAINQLRPRYVVIENVRGLLSAPAHRPVELVRDAVGGSGPDRTDPVLRAAGAVLGDLADLGYDAQWCTVAASDVGACHRRQRVFIVATPADTERSQRHSTVSERRVAGTERSPGEPPREDQSAGEERQRDGDAARGGGAEAVTLLPTPRATDGTKGGPNQRGSSGDLMLPSAVTHLLPTPRRSDGDGGPNPLSRAERMDDVETRIIRSCGTDWGDYETAIRRAEAASGRPAPSPTEPNRNGNPRLSSRFAEWMMMLSDGHVAGIGLSRNEELRALGNGVVPAQAYAALCQLVPIAEAVA